MIDCDNVQCNAKLFNGLFGRDSNDNVQRIIDLIIIEKNTKLYMSTRAYISYGARVSFENDGFDGL